MWMGELRVGDNAKLTLGEKREDTFRLSVNKSSLFPFPVHG